MKFDDPRIRHCNYSGCLRCFKNIDRRKIKEINGRWYCNQKCINEQYKGLAYKGAIHIIHQTFGPEHPVTKQMQRLNEEAYYMRKIVNYDRKLKQREYWIDKNFKKLCHDSGKCL